MNIKHAGVFDGFSQRELLFQFKYRICQWPPFADVFGNKHFLILRKLRNYWIRSFLAIISNVSFNMFLLLAKKIQCGALTASLCQIALGLTDICDCFLFLLMCQMSTRKVSCTIYKQIEYLIEDIVLASPIRKSESFFFFGFNKIRNQ